MKRKKEPENTSCKIRIRGKDNAPLSMQELTQGIFEATRRLEEYKGYRVKWVSLFFTMIDEHGNEVKPRESESVIYPYECAADRSGL